jgi:hypothetical protein
MGISKTIKNRDMFGHPISLNFNRKGDTFNTSIGGIVSILMNILLGVFCYIKFLKMVKRNGDTIIQTSDVTDFEEIGEISLEKIKFMPFVSLKSSRGFSAIELPDFDKYYSITLNQWDLVDFERNIIPMEMRFCTADDFVNMGAT